MAIIKNLVAKAGEYTNKQGETKTRYIKVGVINETDKGRAYRLESPFLPDGGMWLYERDLDPKESAPQAPKQTDIDDSVPF